MVGYLNQIIADLNEQVLEKDILFCFFNIMLVDLNELLNDLIKRVRE